MSFGLVALPALPYYSQAAWIFMASERYRDYLASEAWQQKRWQRLTISKFRCAVCGAKRGIEVHHLTYARIFNEDMADLLPLCSFHHGQAEALVDDGSLQRSGDVLFLAEETIRLLATNTRPNKKDRQDNEVRNRIQKSLLMQSWFQELLKLPRHQFKKAMRNRYKDDRFKVKILSNGCILYDRMH